MSLIRDYRTIIVDAPKAVFDRVRLLADAHRTSIPSEVIRLMIDSLGRIDGDRVSGIPIETLSDAARNARRRK
jgi:hypothetical protein